MWEFPPISCWRKWPRTSRSQIKCTPLFPEEIPAKMWPLPIRDLLFLGKASEKKLVDFRNPHHRGTGSGKGSPLVQTLLGEKRPDISSSSTPEALTILRFWKCLRRVKASAWRRLSMMILYLWSRSSLFYWSNAMWWPPE